MKNGWRTPECGRPGAREPIGDLARLDRLLRTHASEVFDGRDDTDSRIVAKRWLGVAAVCLAVLVGLQTSNTTGLQSGFRGGTSGIQIVASRQQDEVRLDWDRVEGATHYVVQLWDEGGKAVDERVVDGAAVSVALSVENVAGLMCLVEAWDGPDWLSRSPITQLPEFP